MCHRSKYVATRSTGNGTNIASGRSGSHNSCVTKPSIFGGKEFGMVRTGSSYCSQSELPLTFGLGQPEEGMTLTLEITWPSGQVDRLTGVPIDRIIAVKEGTGIVPRNFPKIPAAQAPSRLWSRSAHLSGDARGPGGDDVWHQHLARPLSRARPRCRRTRASNHRPLRAWPRHRARPIAGDVR